MITSINEWRKFNEDFSEQSQKKYLKWKRENVSFRGMQETGVQNGGSAMLGRGLYSAALSNKSMAKGYGKLHFAVNAIPKKPIKFKSLNDWEIWFYNTLVFNYSKALGKEFPDKRDFNAKTTIEAEIQKMGYDGVIIIGREYVNYKPENVLYFNDEKELKDYYTLNCMTNENIKESLSHNKINQWSINNRIRTIIKKYNII